MLSVEELEARLTASKPQAVPIATEHPPPVVTMPPQQQPFYQQALSPQGPPMIPPQQQPVPTTTTNFARPSPPFNNQVCAVQSCSHVADSSTSNQVSIIASTISAVQTTMEGIQKVDERRRN